MINRRTLTLSGAVALAAKKEGRGGLLASLGDGTIVAAAPVVDGGETVGVLTLTADTSELGEGAIHDEVCANFRRIMPMDCASLYIDVDRFVNFQSAGGGVPIQNGNFSQAGIGYDNTVRNDIVLVRGYYEWKFITPMFQPILGNLNNGHRLLVSSVLFRNEPF